MAAYGILLESKYDFSSVDSAFDSVGQNTGNLLFRDALIKELSLIQMTYEEYVSVSEAMKKLPVIVTDLIWINENSNFDYLYQRVIDNPEVKFIPISVGLQSKSRDSEFKLNDSVKKTLMAIQERAIIGVRGYYTAEILEKNGITNIEVIGCPSMYRMLNPKFRIEKKDKLEKVTSNFRTIYGSLTKDEKHFLSYCANNKFGFVEQTRHVLTLENVNDVDYFNYVEPWLNGNKKIFFNVSEWEKYVRQYDFSIGARFHGNVISVWNGVPALFVSIDSRTSEMIEYFKLPSISINDFDETKPVEYYYDLADYTEFNRNYAAIYDRFKQFLIKNGIFDDSSIR